MDDLSTQTMQLRSWIDRMRSGDLKARDELVRHFCDRFEILARKMLRRFPQVKRWAQTDDVLQNSLMRVLRSLQKVEPASVRDLMGLAALEIRRELLDLARHFYGPHGVGANHISQHPDALSVTMVAPEDSSGDIEDLERWQAFHEGVEGLPVEEREVVGLIFYHACTQAEVAELFQVSERTIRRRWESALTRLHARFQDRR